MSFFQRALKTPDSGLQKPQAVQRKKAPLTKREGLTMDDVAKHCVSDDCWVVIHGKVYDVTSFVPKHPGGEILLSYAGMDASDVFDAFHDEYSYKILGLYHIGEVADPIINPLIKEHRDLRHKLEEEGFYQSSKLFYLYKTTFNYSILLTAVYFATSFQAYWAHMLSAVLLGTFWQQMGWLSHDYLHHQVFKNRRWNNFMGYIMGNVSQGFSVEWWKAKHNLHHAVPNVAGGDPDIDTMPFLAWSEKLVENDLEGLPQFLVANQHILYFPLLCAARLSWLLQSIIYANGKAKRRYTELATLAIHHVAFIALLCSLGSFSRAITYLFVSQCSCSLMLAMAFSLNHNGMTVLDSGSQGRMEFNRLQILTGRDVGNGGGLVHWFMGGLDMQVEHHLFPRIPRHRLPEVRKRIMEMCKQYNVPYHNTGFWAGTKELLSRLRTVSSVISKADGA
jgi:fatty acid desaturase